MENKDAFKRWLESGGAKSKYAQDNPVYAIQTIERKLHELGTPFPDLGTAWREDEFKSLLDSLNKMLEDAREDGQDFRVLFPKTENPEGRIKNSIYQLKRYGQFLGRNPPGAAKDAYPIERDGRIDRSALDELKRGFEAACPDFKTFDSPGTGPIQKMLARTREASKQVRQLVDASNEDDQTVGERVMEILSPHIVAHRWAKQASEFPQIGAIIGSLIRSRQDTEEALSGAFDALKDLHDRKTIKLSYAGCLTLASSALSMVRPGDVAPVAKKKFNEVGKRLTGESFFEENRSLASDYRRFAEVLTALFRVMRDNWLWHPRDSLDVRAFLWIAVSEDAKDTQPHKAPAGKGATDEPKNLLLYGPPGTGKTYSTTKEAVRLCGEQVSEDLKGAYRRLRDDDRIEFVTFHQNFAYEDFVEGIRPDLDPYKADLRYKLRDGIFKRIAIEADKRPNERFVLVIDEINRGNIAKIFGELITLIEDSRRRGESDETSVTLPYSHMPFAVPPNLYLIGTMNTADRSIQLLDTALRRRFIFRECMPDPNHDLIPPDLKGVNCQKLLKAMNERIVLLLDREHQIGHTYFFIKKFDQLVEVFQNKVFPLLQEYFFDDWAKIRAVLGNNAFVQVDDKPDQSFLKGDLKELVSKNMKVYSRLSERDEKWKLPKQYQLIYEPKSEGSNSG